jgi:hypothetical protein
VSNALIFIPDISGFTTFVNSTPVEHSQHIISELLEIIIDSNTLGLVVSEIEGDAVLFYREGPPPSQAEILEQVRTMFLAFHSHLKRYESLRICNCDSCSTAQNLTLKFVAHYGKFDFIQVHKHRKPHGPALILAHRLLKNSIEERDYLLMSSDFSQVAPGPESSPLPNWSLPQVNRIDNYDLGDVNYNYVLLESLFAEVPDAPRPKLPHSSRNPIVVESVIPGPLDEVFEMVTNLAQRNRWNPDLKMHDFDENKVNQVGENHMCLIGNNDVLVTTTLSTTQLPEGEGKVRTFGERISQIPMVGQMSLYYFLYSEGPTTRLRVEGHFPALPFFKRPLLFFIKRGLRKNLTKSGQRLKKVFELQASGT